MSNYIVSVGIEPEDAYEKAKMDLMKALESIQSLTPYQQQKLAEEIFGVATVAGFCKLLEHYLGRRSTGSD